MSTPFEVKGQARLLAHYLASIGQPISHTQALEAIARSRGAKSWNVYAASLAVPVDWTRPADLFAAAFAGEAQQVHFRWRPEGGSVAFRFRGGLTPKAQLSPDEARHLQRRLLALFRLQDGRIERGAATVEWQGESCSVMAWALRVVGGTDYVFELGTSSRTLADFNALGITEGATWLHALNTTCAGLFLVAGLAGSGKRTTLQATLAHLEGTCHTVPDPFNPLERAVALKMDPDTFFIPEIRDTDSMYLAVRLVESGHRVLAGLHVNSPQGVLTRLEALLEGLGLHPESLRHNLRGVLFQSLVPTVCPACLGQGCEDCKETGRGHQALLSELRRAGDWLGPSRLGLDLARKRALGMVFPPEVQAGLA